MGRSLRGFGDGRFADGLPLPRHEFVPARGGLIVSDVGLRLDEGADGDGVCRRSELSLPTAMPRSDHSALLLSIL